MPRPKSDLKLVTVKLSEAHRAMLKTLADERSPANASDVVRDAIELLHAKRQRERKAKG